MKAIRFLFKSMCLLVMFLVASCESNNNNETIIINEFSFNEDSLYVEKNEIFRGMFSPHDDGEKETLFFGFSGSIYSYNFQYGMLDTIKLNNGFNYANLSVLNKDTIVLTDIQPYLVYLANSEGNVFKTMDLRFLRSRYKFAPAPYVGSCNPAVVYNNSLYLIGYILGEPEDEKDEKRFVLIQYDLKENKVSLLLKYPEIYKKNNWAGIQYRYIYNTYNQKNNFIILSFPSCHEIYVYNLKDKTLKSFNAGSRYISKIHPFSKKKEWFGYLAQQDYETYFYKNPSYSDIYYDKYRDLYYRIAELPNKKFLYSDTKLYNKKKSIIILDNNFKYVGEKKVSGIFSSYSVFVNKAGLNIVYHSDTDSTMKVKRFIPKKCIL